MMSSRLSRRLRPLVLCALALLVTPGFAQQNFPVGQEMLLDAAPMRPAKRVPSLTIEANGTAAIDLWCKSVAGRVELDSTAIKITAEPLPETLPRMMSQGQCTPARMQADEDVLSALSQVTSWRRQGEALLLIGPTTLKFRPSDH
jgi:heat shock protein HslJ